MRLLFDLIGAQTNGSRSRGIGRYTRELALALARDRDSRVDLRFALSGNFPDAADELRSLLSSYLPADAITTYRTPFSPSFATPQSHPARRVGEALVRRRVAGVAPDCLLASSLYEVAEGDFAYHDLTRQPAQLSAAILYDLIPLRLPKQYLRYANYRRVYNEQTKVVASADLLFAISESTRRDAIDLLGIDGARIVNISGAADATFASSERSAENVAGTLRRLAIRAPFVLCAAGEDARKNAVAAVQAFLLLTPEERQGTQLVVLAPLPDSQIAAIADAMRGHALAPSDILFITRVSDEDLALLYAQAELFLFPSLYEGFGLPVLEAMQCGAAIIAGDHSSIPEIADRADVLCDVSSPASIARALARGLRDSDWRADVRAWGVRRARDFSWASTARRLQDALLERKPSFATSRPRRETPACFGLSETLESELAEILRTARGTELSPKSVAPLALQSAPQLYDGSRRRLLIDVTTIVGSDRKTGIQRVVRNIVRAFYSDASRARAVVPVAVRLHAGRLHTCQGFVSDLLGCAQTVPDAEIDIAPGDCLLMLDNSWAAYARFSPVFGSIRRAGGTVVTCVYDLIPELHPAASVDPVPAVYGAWLHTALRESDGIITISEAVMHDLQRFLARNAVATNPRLKLGWFRCGSDLEKDTHSLHDTCREMVTGAFGGDPAFILVGTLEPRKGHWVALDAFDALWSEGLRAKLLFIGSKGWHVEALIDRLRTHSRFGADLHWISDANDGELAFAYQHCAALLNPSYAEGFGLPIAEAARAGRPVICSDIPVFREVGRDGALYVPVNDAPALAETVRAFLAAGKGADPSRVLQTTWSDAADRIVAVCIDGKWSEALNEVQRNGTA